MIDFKKGFKEILKYRGKIKAKGTIRNMKKIFNRNGFATYSINEFDIQNIEDLEKKHLEAYKAYLYGLMEEKKLTQNTVANYISTSYLFLKWLYDLGAIWKQEIFPFQGFEFTPFGTDSTSYKVYHIEDYVDLILLCFEDYVEAKSRESAYRNTVPNVHVHALDNLLMVVLNTSFVCRRIELAWLKFSDFYSRKGLIEEQKIPEEWLEFLDPQEFGCFFRKKFQRKKSLKKLRSAFVSDVILGLLEEKKFYLEERGLFHEDAYIFSSKQNPNKEIDENVLSKRLAALRRKYNLPDIGFHGIRYTVTNYSRNWKLPEEDIRFSKDDSTLLLAHEGISTKDTHYDKRRLVDQLEISKNYQKYLFTVQGTRINSNLNLLREYFQERPKFRGISL